MSTIPRLAKENPVLLSSYLAVAFPVMGSVIGQFFQPLYQAMAWILAASYSVVPNDALAIAS